jgi:hypothetical protein
MSRPDQCPMCGSLNYIALHADGSRYNPFIPRQPLWAKCQCDECGAIWPFRIIELAEEKEK